MKTMAILLMLSYFSLIGCSTAPSIKYVSPTDDNVALVEFFANEETFYSVCYQSQWEEISEHSVNTGALFDFGVPGFSSETKQSVTRSMHAGRPIVIGSSMHNSRLRCNISMLVEFDKGKKYNYVSTLDWKNKSCRVDLIEIEEDGKEKMITQKITRNYTPCDKLIVNNAFKTNEMYKIKSKKKQ